MILDMGKVIHKHGYGRPDGRTHCGAAAKKNALRRLGELRGTPVYHFSEVKTQIEPGILPLVKAFDSDLTTPIFSCEGHADRKQDPYVVFIVLPGKQRQFTHFLQFVLRNTPYEHMDLRFVHRHKPMRFGMGPFVDWWFSIDIPDSIFKDKNAFDGYRIKKINAHAKHIARCFRAFSSG